MRPEDAITPLKIYVWEVTLVGIRLIYRGNVM